MLEACNQILFPALSQFTAILHFLLFWGLGVDFVV